MTTAKRGDATIIALIVLGVAFLFFVVALAMLGLRPTSGTKDDFGRSDTNLALSGQAYNCSGVTTVPKEYMPYVKTAADRYLGGDQVLLISLVSIESGWHPKSISSAGATGLGQFLASTASGYTGKGNPFYSLNIYNIFHVLSVSSITQSVRQAFLSSPRYSRDGRLQPEPSIFAAAKYFGDHMKKASTDIPTTYAKYYHGGKTASQKAEAQAGAQHLVDTYNKIVNGGGCTMKDPKTNTIEKVANPNSASLL
ncbi:MAG TPA: transglycosylase SLT domain-containing protein [Candidatus Saccharimonadales bacterium]|nr:transglycosylase SLT domain-containing protein [Candidatus Saccharimonadales bacterium]